MLKLKAALLSLTALGASMVASPVLAWGNGGHRMIGEEAAKALPTYMPGFLRSPEGVGDIGDFAREPDFWKGAGWVHDTERDSAHFIDLTDEGLTMAGVGLRELPGSRSDFEALLRSKDVKPWKSGYLPYVLADHWQQIVKDFAYWRALTHMEARETDPAKKAWLKTAIRRREALTLRDIGVFAHYMGDAAQPLHLSIHYNGWGDFPNPNGYTTDKIHWAVEGDYVSDAVNNAMVVAAMPAPAPCMDKIELCFAAKLERNFKYVIPLYDLHKAGGFAEGDPRGVEFVTGRLGQGAADLRDVLTDAWRESKTMKFGYPGMTYEDLLAGKGDPWTHIRGDDDKW